MLASSASLEQLTASVSSMTTFVNQTRNDVNVLQNEFTALSATNQDIREQFIARIGTTINIETPAGSVTGLLIAVGDDYLEILETSGSIAIVRIAKINSFS
ncbi:YuzF family protein [Paenibacillus sepulcri]|uniref:YuzF family protein n=1 Tax=Paenibacillus sepulcri TaxID=359917 RepID=A0ABS7C7W3_9BACL|nr:YuzF family protein [Paenibacillus sepulcri]